MVKVFNISSWWLHYIHPLAFYLLKVACFGRTKYTAFLKALMSAGFRLPPEGGNILIGAQQSFFPFFLPLAKQLSQKGYKVIFIYSKKYS